MKISKKTLILDMDGTIREPISNSKFINNPKDQRIIESASIAIKYFAQKDYLIIGITNQGGVAAGHKSLNDCIEEQQNTILLCPLILKIYFCPDYEGKKIGCVYSDGGNLLSLDYTSPNPDIPDLPTPKYPSFRKPGSGMIEYILNTHDIDIQNSIYVGDRQEDRDCVKDINCSFLWAEQWRSLFGKQK